MNAMFKIYNVQMFKYEVNQASWDNNPLVIVTKHKQTRVFKMFPIQLFGARDDPLLFKIHAGINWRNDRQKHTRVWTRRS